MGDVFGRLDWSPIYGLTEALPDHVTAPAAQPGLKLLEASAAGLLPAAIAAGRRDRLGSDQFAMFQFNPGSEGPPILDLLEVAPSMAGGPSAPDARLKAELLAFQAGDDIEAGRETTATLRLDIGAEPNPRAPADILYWSAATALDLFAGGKKTKANQLKDDLTASFGPRAAEIPGALAQIRFEVVAHAEPPWWRRLFRLGTTDSAQTLIRTLGFPGITIDALNLIDSVFDKIDQVSNKPLFVSRPLVVALTGAARDDFTGGLPAVSLGVLNPGFYLLARQRDLEVFRSTPPQYHASYRILAPAAVSVADLNAGRYDDPYAGLTYAVIRVRTEAVNLGSSI